LREPVEYFRQFFHLTLLNHIVEQSDVYAAQCNSNFQITETELEIFLGTLLKMGLSPMPRYSMYWSTEVRCDANADAGSGNEAVLDRESPRYDRLFKIRPLIESIRQSCLQYQSIDEEIIPYKGRNKLKQYIPKKPKKWGFKVNARTGVSWLLYDFCFYEGKMPRVKKPSGCLSFDVVMKLCETITESELEAFLGTLLKMGLVPKPRYSMYWSTELRCDAIADAMSRNRFREVLRYLHFNDNSETVPDRESPCYDRLFKIRPLIESIRQSCLRLEQEEYHTSQRSQRNKASKLTLGVSGLLYDFCFYEGKVPRVKKPSGCLSFDVVMKLCETVPKHRNFKIFFDNYFTHLDLQLRLLKKGIHTIRTIR
ncbi:PiggyBac transposable element-derived protein 3, partial [Trichinella britovi]